MSLTVEVDANAGRLAKALGLIDADGRLVPGWFEHPLEGVRRALSDETQRAALLELLQDLLPPDDAAPDDAGARWHPLLERDGPGNIYLTVEGGVIGVAAAIATDGSDPPLARAGIRLPLVEAGEDDLRAVAGTADGPLQMVLDAEWGAGAHPSAIRVRAGVDLESGARLLLILEDLEVGGVAIPSAAIDPARLDADAVRALEALIASLLAGVSTGEPRVDRVIAHLPGLLGLDPALPPLPLDALAGGPGALRDWLAALVGDAAALRAWFTHLAGILGADLPAAAPAVAGSGTAADPFRATLLDLGAGAGLELLASSRADPAGGVLLGLGLGLRVAADLGALEAAATIAEIPIAGASPATVLPEAQVRLRVPADEGDGLVSSPPDIAVGSLVAGIRWSGGALEPTLALLDVVLAGSEHDVIDLTDANSVAAAASAAVEAALDEAIGAVGVGRALRALIGLAPPATDPASTLTTTLADLLARPTRAIGEVHRSVLADTEHPWSHMLGEIAVLLHLPPQVDGAGTQADPWRVAVAREGAVALSLAAWRAPAADDPPGTQHLRLGLRLSGWEASWLAEVLAFDLPEGAAGSARLLAGQHPALEIGAGEGRTPLGRAVAADAIRAVADWAPGEPLSAGLAVEGLRLQGDGPAVGPLRLQLPPPGGFDATRPDLGLGVDVAVLEALLRELASEAIGAWGGEAGAALAGLLGLQPFAAGLPEGWPNLAPPIGDPAALLADPLGALRDWLRRLVAEETADGAAFAALALGRLGALLGDGLPRVAGSGTRRDPWALPLASTGPAALEGLVWLEPGPPAAWREVRVRQARAGAGGAGVVAAALELASAVPELADALAGRDPAEAAAGLDRLAEWLAAGDGVVPFDASAPGAPGTWITGEALASAHHRQPADPEAIARIGAQLAEWDGDGPPTPVLLLGPAFSDHEIWRPLLAAREPERPPGAHADLRRPGLDPLAPDLSGLRAVAGHYTADLADDGTGDVEALAAQAGAVLDRILAVTGAAQVTLVAHSTAGVAALRLASLRPGAVRGVVTLGSPHRGSDLAPLTDPALADAVRAARALAGDGAASPLADALAHLAEALDGHLPPAVPGGPFRRRPYPRAAFAAPGDPGPSPVPGLALGSRLPGDLAGELAAALAARAEAADAPATAVPDRLATGLRARVAVPADPGGVGLDATVRADAGTIALDPSPTAEASLRRLEIACAIERAGGWLAGDAGAPGDGAVRVRRAELLATVAPSPTGGTGVTADLRLHEAAAGSPTVPLLRLGDPLLAQALQGLVDALAAEGGAAATLAVDALAALGLAGGGADPAAALPALAAQPLGYLGARAVALLDAVAPALGLAGGPGGPWTLAFAEPAVRLAIAAAPWSVSARTAGPAGAGVPLGGGVSAAAELALSVPAMTPTVRATLALGAARVSWDTATRALRLAAPPWLAPVALLPAPGSAVLRDRLAPAVPGLMASAAVSVLLAGRAGAPVAPIDALIADPRGWLLRPDALGRPDGAGIDPAKVAALVMALGEMVGIDRDGDALLLPAGLRLSAAGADPLDLGLAGRIDIGPEDRLAFDLGVLITPAPAVSGRGDLRLEVALPGTWGRVAIAFSADPSGLGLTVTPDGAAPVTLLPRFDGLGALAAGAATLLPRALQAIVDELRGGGPPTGLLAAALALAEAVGIYADDARGFEHPDRAAELARMLQPGWIESRTATAGAVADALEGLFGAPPLVDLPIGTVARVGDAIRWSHQLPAVGGEVRVTGGWTTAGAAAQPSLLIEALGLDLGPVVVESAAFGYDGDVSAALVARLDVDGQLAFLRPALRVGVAEDRFALDLLPLGVAEEADLAVRIVPAPGVVATTDGALALLERWGVPLAATALLQAFEDRLGDPLWGGGPSSRAVLQDSGLVQAGAGPPALASPLPPLPSVLLRAAQALLGGMEVEITGDPLLKVAFVTEEGRSGVRLSGRVDVGGGDMAVSVRFGDADWLDETGGVTLWLLEATTEPIPVRLAPGLGIAGVGVVLTGTEEKPLIDGAFRVGAAGGLLFLDAEFLDAARDPAVEVGDLGAGIELGDCQVVLGADSADSFLQRVLPLEMRSPFDLSVAYSSDGGLVFRGPGSGDGNGFELTFPLDLDFEVIRISELILRLGIEDGTAEIEAALSGGAFVGPVAAVVQRVGVVVVIREGGAELRFRPPDGIGLSIDASAIALGGFLLIDSEHGRYVGALEITVLDSFHLAAIAIITTKMPDGSDGFTLLFVISITFPVPITLGYGFFFAGAGGLLGLNRSVDLDRLRTGLRTGTADSILFPTDIIRRIDTIIRDLEETFPIDQGQFLVGPMALITWSSPPLISLKLGVILEIGSPVKVAILGVLRAALPTPDAAVVDLKVAFLGTVDVEAGLLTFDAAIYD